MSENFQEAPLPIGSVFRRNDHVILLSKPVGEPRKRYRISVRISSIHDGIYQGFITSVENADDHERTGDFFHSEERISFEKRHIQGIAAHSQVNG